ncbi:MAG: flagellar hook-length control protein FliK [Candidatus Sericytochromatia bacterium]
MQLGTPRLNLPPAPKAPEPPREAAPAPDAGREVRAREEAFERALTEELDRKDLLEPRPIWASAAQSALAEETTEAITAAEAAAAAGLFKPRQATPVLPWSAARMPVVEGEAVAPVAEQVTESQEEIAILVEPGLPQVQPTFGQSKGPVPLVEFPQVVVGQVRQMQKDNQPVTQLDFEISPPHIGPVNLQIALQNGAVNVQLVALTMQAKQALENQVGQIQSILQSHAITGQVKVVTASQGRGGAGASGKGDQPNGFGFSHGGRRRGSAQEDLAIQA